MFGREREHLGQESTSKKRLSEVFTAHSLASNNDIYSKKKITKYISLGFFPFSLPGLSAGWGYVVRQPSHVRSATLRYLLNRDILKVHAVLKSPLVMLIATSLLPKQYSKTNSEAIVFRVGGKVIVDD